MKRAGEKKSNKFALLFAATIVAIVDVYSVLFTQSFSGKTS